MNMEYNNTQRNSRYSKARLQAFQENQRGYKRGINSLPQWSNIALPSILGKLLGNPVVIPFQVLKTTAGEGVTGKLDSLNEVVCFAASDAFIDGLNDIQCIEFKDDMG